MSPAALRIAEVFAVDLAELIPLSAVPQREMNVFLVPGEDSANEHVPPQRILTSHNNDNVCVFNPAGPHKHNELTHD